MAIDLPDVDVDSWRDFATSTFHNLTDAAISSLGNPTQPTMPTSAPGSGYDPSSLGTRRAPAQAPVEPPSPEPEQAPAPEIPAGLTPSSPLPSSFGGAGTTPERRSVAPPSPAPPSVSPAPQGDPDLVAMALNAADQVGVDRALFAQLVGQESGWNPRAGSPAGAQGLTQLMPATARGLGVTDPYDPWQSLLGGAKYLKQQIDRFGGDVVKGLAAYNAGPGAVEQYNGVPPFEETQRYVNNIMGRLAAEQSPNPAGGVYPGPTEGVARAGGALSDARTTRQISQFGDPQLSTDEA